MPVNTITYTQPTQVMRGTQTVATVTPTPTIENLILRRVDIQSNLPMPVTLQRNNSNLSAAAAALFEDIERTDFDPLLASTAPMIDEPPLNVSDFLSANQMETEINLLEQETQPQFQFTLYEMLGIVIEDMMKLPPSSASLIRTASIAASAVDYYKQLLEPNGTTPTKNLFETYVNDMPHQLKTQLRAVMHTTHCQRAFEVLEMYNKNNGDQNPHIKSALDSTKEFIVQCTVNTESTEQSNINLQTRTPIWVDKVEHMKDSEKFIMNWFVSEFNAGYPTKIIITY